ncbi:MAG: leucine-rich repeat domain-containing protein [Proteobacteria bacterium]|nr:leucine-rich repeat domain-containing protein [Pseudomonadota bacterium]
MADHGPSEFGKILGSLLNALGKKIQESVEQARTEASASPSGTSADGKLGPLNYHIEFQVKGDKDKKKTKRAVPAEPEQEETHETETEAAIDEAALKALDAFFNADGMPSLDSDNDPDFDSVSSMLIRYQGKKQVVTVPEGIETIGPNAFKNADSVRKVILPDSVTAIEGGAFQSCISLKEIIFSNNISLIAEEAFAECISLERVCLPDSATEIEDGAFRDCRKLREITLSPDLVHIPSNLFKGCLALETIHYKGKPETVGTQVFEEIARRSSEFCYFTENAEGDYVRTESDHNPYMDSASFEFADTPYAEGFSRTLQNVILSNAPWNMEAVSKYAEMCKFALRFSNLLSGSEIYIAFHVVRLCVEVMQGIASGNVSTTDLKTYMATRIMALIGGSGSDLEALDRKLAPAAMHDFSVLNGEASDSQPALNEMLSQLDVTVTPYRYHPGIYHCCAYILKNSTYWDFLICLEGLMRGRGIDICKVAYRPEPGEQMDGWCRAWSIALETHKVSIVRIGVPAVFGGLDDVIAILSDSDARSVKALFDDCGIDLAVEIYSAGQTSCGLRLV